MLRSYEEDVEEAMKQCLLLLEEPDLETGVRSGDIYGFMIEHYASTADYQKVGCQSAHCTPVIQNTEFSSKRRSLLSSYTLVAEPVF